MRLISLTNETSLEVVWGVSRGWIGYLRPDQFLDPLTVIIMIMITITIIRMAMIRMVIITIMMLPSDRRIPAQPCAWRRASD